MDEERPLPPPAAGAPPDPESAREDAAIAATIGRWQEKLLQLDRRNRLLYFREGRAAVPLPETSPEEVAAWLDSPPKKRWRFVELDDGSRPTRRGGAVRTRLEPKELRRRLTGLRRREREWEEEQGLNVLFLAVGLLEWTDLDRKPAVSPLTLVPCDLARESVSGPWYLKREDDEVESNVTLAHLLRLRFDLTLPEYEEQGIPDYLEAVRNAVADKKEWKVAPEVFLGTFAFSKMAMYEDLERMRTEGVTHPLVRRLAGGEPKTDSNGEDPAAGGEGPSALPPDEDLPGGKLDDLLEVRDQYTVVDADFSQLRAIDAARRGETDQVIHGPPGTGKSQTITNMIAGLLADGKRVLFVSEKTAALDVVKKRLDDCGLGGFCLDLHSERGRKQSVYAQLKKSVDELGDSRRREDDRFPYDELAQKRDALNRFVRALHREREPLGRSVFRVQGDYAGVRDFPDVEFEVGDPAALDAELRARIEEAAERVSRRPEPFRQHTASPWIGLVEKEVSLGLTDSIGKTMTRLGQTARRAEREAGAAAEWTGLVPAAKTAAECFAAAARLDHLSAGGGVPKAWLEREVLPRLERLAEEQERRQTERRKFEAAARGSFGETRFGETRPEADWGDAAERLRRVAADARALEELLGPDWRRRVLPNTAQLLERCGALERAAAEAVRTADGLGELLPGERPKTASGFDAAIAAAEGLAALFPAPSRWLRPKGFDEARKSLAALEKQRLSLDEAETQLFAEFDEEILDLVDRKMLRRFRGDYRSWFGRLRRRSAYREDLGALRGADKTGEKRRVEDWRRAVKLALDLRYRRNDWKRAAKSFEEQFGGRFRGRETDTEEIARALDEVERLSKRWPGDPKLRQALTDEGRRGELLAFLPGAKKTAAAFRAAAAALEPAPETPSADESADEPDETRTDSEPSLADRAGAASRALDPLRTLAALLDEIGGGFRTPPDDFSALSKQAAQMAALARLEREDRAAEPELRADFGPRFTGPDTDWVAIRGAIAWTKQALDEIRRPLQPNYEEHLVTPRAPAEYARRAETLRAAASAVELPFETATAFFEPAHRPRTDGRNTPFDHLADWADELAGLAPTVTEWLHYRSAVRTLEDLLGPGLVTRIRKITDDAGTVPGIVRRRLCRAWLDDAYRGTPELAGFDPTDHTHLRNDFRRLDRNQFTANQQRVRSRCFANYPDLRYADAGNLGLLKRELTKKRRQMPARRLLRRIPGVVQALKPCMLMSPLAVSQYLQWGGLRSERIEFDAVIFDEASQVFPEDAVPAIARALRTILAGDAKQLPPTNFFRSSHDEDGDRETDDDDEDGPLDRMEGQESILDVMQAMVGSGVREQHLTVHYRSRHEDLIRYSNHHFYDDRLLVFPSPGRDTSLGMRDVPVPEGRYEAGASRTNPVEAERVADLVIETLETTPPNESVGVVALSRAQADRIDGLLLQRRLERRDLDDRFSESAHERFFVKNLENVQGDERDHIILSIGYGPTLGSERVPQRFGPINREGGKRRLNVAVTRARRTMTLVHSLRADQVSEHAKTDGPRLLKRYLEYAADPDRALERRLAADPDAEPESPFEEAVLAALAAKGYRVTPQVGVADYRIDLGIEGDRGFDLGIECDGAKYHSAPAARDRDRIRQEVLEGLGWTIHRVWSTAWARNPDEEVRKIERALARARSRRNGTGGAAAVPKKPTTAQPADERADARPNRRPEEPPDRERSGRLPPPITAEPDAPPPPPPAAAGPDGWAGDGEGPPLFDEYRAAPLNDIAVGPDFLSDTDDSLRRLVRRVAEVEGPIHPALLAARLCARYGIRAGKRILRRIARALPKGADAALGLPPAAGAPPRETVFCTVAGRDPTPRRPPPGAAPRKIDHIPNRELEAGILLVARKCLGGAPEELLTRTAREFGFRRTGAKITERLDRALTRLHASGRLRKSGDSLVPTDP